jgi:predicted GIY-YIG superfamily endonuclease
MKTYLYKTHNSDGHLLYVGITNNIDQRLIAHKATKSWWNEVDEIVLKIFSTREEAIVVERDTILDSFPKYNEVVTSKEYNPQPEKRYPTSHAKLPQEELQHLRGLDGDVMLQRAAELQAAGWSVAAILEGARVAPTAVQLRTALKYIYDANTGFPVPRPPMGARLKREERLSKIVHMSEDQKEQLIELSQIAKKFRPQFRGDHPVAIAAQEYRDLINYLKNVGVSVQEMANAVGCDEGNIRRRLVK